MSFLTVQVLIEYYYNVSLFLFIHLHYYCVVFLVNNIIYDIIMFVVHFLFIINFIKIIFSK